MAGEARGVGPLHRAEKVIGMRGRVAATILAATLLAACADTTARAPIACPRPSIPADAADLTRYRPGAVRDLTTLEFDARLNGLEGGCRPGRREEGVVMEVTPNFIVDRGAAAEGRAVDLPWSVAVIDDRTGEPLGRPQRFRDTAVFRPNETRAGFNGQTVSINLPVSESRRATDYRVLVFMQLTEEELALNRRRGPR
jgi:hypothetical protein